MNKTPYIDFYGKHNISPVVNNFDKNFHFYQRNALYHHLGIYTGFIKGKKVLEFGPGNGINAIHTISMKPLEYTLVDANLAGINNCKENLKRYSPNGGWKIIDSLIEDYKSTELFDLVICEGLLPNQINQSMMAKHCSSFVNKKGVIILTCHDMVSSVSETLRGMLGEILIKDTHDFDQQVTVLANFFESHLKHLKGASRTAEEWVVDNILQTDFWKEAPLFTIPEAIKSLEDDFTVINTSPSFFLDWSWYKDVNENTKDHFNKIAVDSYWGSVHNFIDYSFVTPNRGKSDNKLLYDICNTIRDRVSLSSADNKTSINLVVEACSELLNALPVEQIETKLAIESYISGINYYINEGKVNSEIFSYFESWWGRGTQYISFIKS